MGLSSLNQLSSGVGLPTALQEKVALSPTTASIVLMGTIIFGASTSGFSSDGIAEIYTIIVSEESKS